MKKIIFAVMMGASAIVPVMVQQAAVAAVTVVVSKPLFDVAGKRVGPVYRVAADGSAILIVNSKLVTVPVATLSEVDGRLTTSLTKRQIR